MPLHPSFTPKEELLNIFFQNVEDCRLRSGLTNPNFSLASLYCELLNEAHNAPSYLWLQQQSL